MSAAAGAAARCLTRLEKPLSADDRKACRSDLLLVARTLVGRGGEPAWEAARALRRAVRALRGHGWNERQINDELRTALFGPEEDDDAQG